MDKNIYDNYIEDRRFNGVAESTLKNYELQIATFCAAMEVKVLRDFDLVTRLQYKGFTRKLLETKKTSTVNNWIRGIDAFLWSLYEDKILTEDTLPSTKFAGRRKKFYKEKRDKSMYLKDSVLDEIQLASPNMTIRLFFATMRYTGCRVNEVCGMKLSQLEDVLDSHGNIVTYKILLPITKGDNPRHVELFPELVDAIRKNSSERKIKSDYIFLGSRGTKTDSGITPAAIWGQAKKISVKLYGGEIAKKIHPHLWRKATSTNWRRKGYTDQQIGLALGHSPVSVKNNGGKRSVTNERYNLMTSDMVEGIFASHPIRI